MASVNLKILSDFECEIHIDSEYIATATKNSIYKVQLSTGEYWLQIVCIDNPNYTIEKIVTLDSDKVVKVSFADLITNSPGKLRDDELFYCSEERCYKNLLSGCCVTPSIYDEGERFIDGVAKVRKGTLWGFIDKENNEVIPCKYERIEAFNNGIAKVRRNFKWGYIDNRGKEVIPCVYDEFESFINEAAKVKKDFKWGYINKDGKEIIPCIYDYICKFINNRSKVKRNNKFGYINRIGVEIIKCKYDILEEQNDSIALVSRNKRWGKIDLSSGIEILPCYFINKEMTIKEVVIDGLYCYGSDFSEGLLRVEGDTGFGYINESQEIVIKCKYEEAESFKDGVAAVKYDGKWGYIKTDGSTIIPFQYEDTLSIGKYIVFLKTVDGWYCFEKSTGKKLNEIPYDEVDDGRNYRSNWDEFIDDRIPVSRKGRWGYVNKKGDEVIACKFKEKRRFSNGLCAVCRLNRYGYIDVYGSVVVDFKYDYARDFNDGIAEVRNAGLYGIINLQGEEIITCQYDSMFGFYHGLAVVSKKIKTQNYGLLQAETAKIRSVNNLASFANTVYAHGVIDINGQVIIPCRDIHRDISILRCGLISITIFEAAKEKILRTKPFVVKEYGEVCRCELRTKSGLTLRHSSRSQNQFELSVGGLSEGLIRFYKDDKWCFIDSSGNQVIEPKYESVEDFRNGLAAVKINGKWGFIDTKGNIIVAPKY